MIHARTSLAAALTLALASACSNTGALDDDPARAETAQRASNPRCVAPAAGAPALLSQLGCFEGPDLGVAAKGVVEYEPQAALWSDGAGKPRYFAIPDGAQIHVEADGHFTFPAGSVLVKSFVLDGRRVETRVFFRYADGSWGAYSYEWNDAQTDAVLLEGSKQKTVGGTTWSFPSRRDCFRCHNASASVTIGPEIAQLNGPIGAGPDNQLDVLAAAGYFDSVLPAAAGRARLPRYDDATASLEDRARAYLHGNCAHCHRPGGPGYGTADYRFSTPFASMGICDQPARTSPSAVLFSPGASASSLISTRMHALDYTRMPALGTALIDPVGTDLVDRWIDATKQCPPRP